MVIILALFPSFWKGLMLRFFMFLSALSDLSGHLDSIGRGGSGSSRFYLVHQNRQQQTNHPQNGELDEPELLIDRIVFQHGSCILCFMPGG